MLALVNDEVMISHDGGRNWHEGFPAQSADGLTAVAAPEGIWPGAPLVIGRNDGEITCVSLSY